MHALEPEIRRELVNLYETELPSVQNMRIVDLVRIADGWETEVYSFALEYEEAAQRKRQDLILRIYPGDDAQEKSAREFHAMRQLYQVGFPVPQVLPLESEGSRFGKPYVIMERIEGRPMGDIIGESPTERKIELATQFCGMFVDLTHQVSTIIHGNHGLMIQSGIDMLVVSFCAFSPNGINRRGIVFHQGGGNIILGAEGITGT